MRDDDRKILDPVQGDEPSKEFVDRLWTRLDTAWHSQADSHDTDPSPTPIEVAAFDDKEKKMDGRLRLIGWAGVAAAVIAVIVGVAVFAVDDGEGGAGLDTADQTQDDATPDDGTADGDGEAVADDIAQTDDTGESVDDDTAETEDDTAETDDDETAQGVDPEFEFTIIEVEGQWTVGADENAAWGAVQGSDELMKLDLATNTIVSTIEIADGAIEFVDVGPNDVWVVHQGGMVTRVDKTSETVVATIDTGRRLGDLDIGVDDVWIGTVNLVGEDQDLVRIDQATNSVVAEIDVGPAYSASVGAGGVWMIADSTAIRIDPDTNTVVASVEVGGVGGFAVGPDAAWNADFVNGTVQRIGPETYGVDAVVDISAAVGTGVAPFAIGVSGSGRWAWVRYAYACGSGPCTEGVALIDTSTNAVVATADLPSGFGQGPITVGPSTAWVTRDGALARIDF